MSIEQFYTMTILKQIHLNSDFFFFLALDLYHGMFFHVANKTLTVLVTS